MNPWLWALAVALYLAAGLAVAWWLRPLTEDDEDPTPAMAIGFAVLIGPAIAVICSPLLLAAGIGWLVRCAFASLPHPRSTMTESVGTTASQEGDRDDDDDG